MLSKDFEAHSEATLKYLRSVKQKIAEENTEKVLHNLAKDQKKRGFVSAIKNLYQPHYSKIRSFQ